jgi:hypothetical protein
MRWFSMPTPEAEFYDVEVSYLLFTVASTDLPPPPPVPEHKWR